MVNASAFTTRVSSDENMMIYIHGTNHNTQHRGTGSDPEGASRFEKLVESLCGEKDILVVAEEFSKEACEYSDVKASVCHQGANRLQLRHIYCDPISSERTELGIPSQAELVERVKKELGVKIIMGKESNDYYDRLAAQYHNIREKFWLTKLEPHKGENVLFICGSDHIDSFAAMLTKDGWEVETV